jgi:acyl-CoA hydrolase
VVEQVSVAVLAARLGERQCIFIPGSSGEPLELTQLLAGDSSLAPRVRFVTTFVPGINSTNLAPVGSARRMQVFFHAPEYADARRQGTIEFCPFSYSTIFRYLADPATRIDCMVVQVSRPNADGCCSLGPAVEFVPALLQRKCPMFAIVNSCVPHIPGSLCLPLDAFECYANSDMPLAQYDAGPPNAISDAIAAHLRELIPSGATLQVGLGKVPSQLLQALGQRRDVSFHSGMLSDSVLAFAEDGVERAGDAFVTTVVVGSASFYRRLSRLPGLRIAGVDYTHDPAVLARIPRLFAVNSAIEVDVLGQVNAEMVGRRYVSGPGGLPDFAHAARRCNGGLSVIALNSTDTSGRRSKIVGAIEAGTPVTVPQHDVDAVVTEWGAALLRGCDLDERARRLIAVAHPDHRQSLQKLAPS